MSIDTGPSREFPYPLDEFQVQSLDAIDRGDHLLVTAHTGSGKTTIAEYAVRSAVHRGMKVIYTAPIKALSNQIYGDFCRKYPEWNIGIKTGDIDLKSDAQVLIMTTEILHNMLYTNSACLEQHTIVVFDEVHYIKDKERGPVWEASIMMMPKHIQMIMLSATLPDAEDFRKWISECKGMPVTHCTTTKRAVPLTHYLLTPGASRDRQLIQDSSETFYSENYERGRREYHFEPTQLHTIMYQIPTPALFFSFNQAKCEQFARYLSTTGVHHLDSLEVQEIDSFFGACLRKVDISEDDCYQINEVRGLVAKGVAYHHAGLLPILKEIVQELFTKGHIRVLFVTETFAAGVNMPAKSVVFTGLTKYDDYYGTFRFLYPEEYRQMAGRAGRRGLDKEGNVFLLPFHTRDLAELHQMHDMMCGAVRPIVSRFAPTCEYVLRLIASGLPLDTNITKCLHYRQSMVRAAHMMAQLGDAPIKPEIDEDLYKMHQKYVTGQLRQGASKAYQKSLKSKPAFLEQVRLYTEYLTATERRCALEREIETLQHAEYQLHDTLEELRRTGFITSDDQLTIKGRMAADIREADGMKLADVLINLSEIITSETTSADIITVLSAFLDQKQDDRSPVIPHSVSSVTIELTRRGVEIENMQYSDIVYSWLQYGSLNAVYQETGTSEKPGLFVRNMLKLNNICKDSLKACQHLHQSRITQLLEPHHSLIIRNIVVPNSLYIAKS